MKVLISGAGITGNALAFWLSKLGHDVTVVERFANLRATGLQIDLRGHGIEVMKRMGLEQAFRSKSAPEQGVQLVDKSGKRRAYFPANKSGSGPQSFTTDWEIMRGDLCNLIYDETKSRTKYIFGTSIESVEEKNGSASVEVRFKDGKTDHYDLLVGADGVASRTRKMMLGPDTPDASFPLGGSYVAYFIIPRPIQTGEEYIATVYMGPHRKMFMTRRQNANEIQVYAGGKANLDALKNARGDVGKEKAVVAEMLTGAGYIADEIVKALPDVEDFYCEYLTLVKTPSWSRGCVTLVGDAAYCPTANTGMGTTCGLVGAYILAGEIGRHCGGGDTEAGIPLALEAYEKKFQPFMAQVQKGVLEGSKDSAWDAFISTSFGIAVLYRLVGVASFFKVDISRWMMREEVKGWELPDYEELLRTKGV